MKYLDSFAVFEEMAVDSMTGKPEANVVTPEAEKRLVQLLEGKERCNKGSQ